MALNRVTQTSFKPYNQVMHAMTNDYPFYERGAIAVQNRKDVNRTLYGVPSAMVSNLQSPQYGQPMDIVAQYRNRALPIPVDMITAAMVNGQASFLTYASPIFLTSEKNFQSKHREINQVGFSRIPQAGIPHEQTSTEITWNTTVEKFSFSFPMLTDYALDDNYGAEEWAFQLGGMASNAMYTVYQQIAFGFVQIGYENIVTTHMKNTPFDLSKLLMKECESFCVAATDPDRLFKMVREFENTIPGANMVIMPQGTSIYISKEKGESTIMPIQRISQDPQTNRIILELDELNGPRTIKTIQLGDRYYQFVEMPNFRVNMQDDRTIQPLMTAATICQMTQCDPDLTALTASARESDINDPYMYFQTKTNGEMQRVSYIEGIRSSFYFDYKSGKVSKLAEGFVEQQNTTGSFPPDDGEYLDIEDSDNNSPHRISDIADKSDLRQMKKFREVFVGLTFLRDERRFAIPDRLGSFHLRHLPNVWVKKDAEAIHKELNCFAGINSDNLMRESLSLLNDIANTVPTQAYLLALGEENAPFSHDSNGDLVGDSTPFRKAYRNAGTLIEWKGNEHGALRLPKKRNGITDTYPWGFDSGPGLLTLAKEADKENSDWREAGERAKRVVSYLQVLEQFIDKYVGDSDTINPAYTLPWFHVDEALASLVDHLRPYKAPVFLYMPAAVGVANSGSISVDANKFHLTSQVEKFFACFGQYEGQVTSHALLGAATMSIAQSRIVNNIMNFVIATCVWESSVNKPSVIAFVTIVTLHLLDELSSAKSQSDFDAIEKSLDKLKNGKTAAAEYSAIIKKDEARWLPIKNDTSLRNDDKKRKFDEEAKLLSQKPVDALPTYTHSSRGPVKVTTYQEAREELDRVQKEYQNALDSGSASDIETARDNLNEAKKAFVGANSVSSSTVKYANTTSGNGRYLRAPLVASEKIIEYLRSLNGATPLVLMADPGTLFETVVERYDQKTFVIQSSFKSANFNSPANFTLDSLPLSFASLSGLEEQQQGSFSSQHDDDNNIFASLKTKKSTNFMNDIFSGSSSFGRPYEMDNNRSDRMVDRFRNRSRLYADISEEQPYHKVKDIYIAPWIWDARMAFMKDRIKSPTEKFLFKAIITAPNEAKSFTSPAMLGQKLINVNFIRPFIEQRVSSVLVLEAGPETALTPIGGFSLNVSKEERGITHTRMDFNTGLIKVNPNNIGMIYGCIPDSHIGGMKLDFLREVSDFVVQNPHKPSIIAMLTPVSESDYEYPVHLTGLNYYNRNDTVQAHLRKASFSQFFEFVFDSNTLDAIEGMHEERKSHGHHVQVSLVAHKAPCGYRDYSETAHRIKWVNGTGPRGSLEMNYGNAYLTHNGKATYFPAFNQ